MSDLSVSASEVKGNKDHQDKVTSLRLQSVDYQLQTLHVCIVALERSSKKEFQGAMSAMRQHLEEAMYNLRQAQELLP